MTLKVKKDGAWKEASSLKVKINGEWKDVSTLYSKKDGAWVTVYSSGALITFSNYPYPIPVAKGWKYSSDKVNWTTVSADGEINTSGTFTGFIKANSITLSDYYQEMSEGQEDVRIDGTPLSTGRNITTSFVNNEKAYVCGGYGGSTTRYLNSVDVYDIYGVLTSGKSLGRARCNLTSFVNGGKGYVCGGEYADGVCSSVDIYDKSGNKTYDLYGLWSSRSWLTSFTLESKGYVCGGYDSGNYKDTIDVFDSSGNSTHNITLSTGRCLMTSFVIGSFGCVCGGRNGAESSTSNFLKTLEYFTNSGTHSTGSSLSVARASSASFVNGDVAYVCGGYSGGGYSSSYKTNVDVYTKPGVRTSGTPLSRQTSTATAFSNNSKGYVCGGGSDGSSVAVVNIYDSAGNMTIGTSLSAGRPNPTSFVNGNRGYVCGGGSGGSAYSKVDIYYDEPDTYSTKLPITEGSEYTLNGESGVADISKVMEFDSKVSGTIKYKAGDMSPSVRITVVDESGNVVEGATISVEKRLPDWDMSNMVLTIYWDT